MSYFTNFDSWVQAREGSKSFYVVVEQLNGNTAKSSPIPMEAFDDVVEELEMFETGGPIHLWAAAGKQFIVIPHSQVAAVQLVFG